MYDMEKREVLDCALELKRNRLVSLSGGNVSVRMPDDTFLVTPSGMIYEQMTADDVVRVDAGGGLIDGRRKPSSDTPALLHMFALMPRVKAIIHTHQPYATAAGFAADVIPEFLITLIDANRAPVRVAPFTPSSDIGMGELAVQYSGDALAVILKHHGVMAYGATLSEALYSAVYLEEAAKTYVLAKAMGAVIPPIPEEGIAREKAGWQRYGQ
jgi:L-ribulose-5-phosphate 4-epimerase